jgi:hypothetical protein
MKKAGQGKVEVIAARIRSGGRGDPVPSPMQPCFVSDATLLDLRSNPVGSGKEILF